MAEPRLVLNLLVRLRLVLEGNQAALIVRARTLADERHGTVTLEVRDRCNGCVDWQLVVVRTQTVSVVDQLESSDDLLKKENAHLWVSG